MGRIRVKKYAALRIITVCLLFLFFIGSGKSQDSLFIQGKVVDSQSHQPLPYAHVFNQSALNGTITNTDGYFKLGIRSFSDTIHCSFIGYQKQLIHLKPQVEFYSVHLIESVKELNEVVVSAKDESYLFDLVLEAKKSRSAESTSGKAYFDLKSFVDEQQIEQVEGFYNVEVKNYDPVKLNIKTGRIALRPQGKRLFTSLESSRVFTMQKTFQSSDYFPLSPLENAARKSKKIFIAHLSDKYVDDQSDTVYIIHFIPKKDSTRAFTTTVWFKPEDSRIIKINYAIRQANIHPFYPVFKSDSIKSVGIDITKTFESSGGIHKINHIDFAYRIIYKSKGDTLFEVKTRALLQIYDFDSMFQLPYFRFSDENIGDYRKINAIPHNDYFWKHNAELRLNDQFDRNNEFYSNPLCLTNEKIFSANHYGPFGLMQHPYVQWSGKRILFKEKDSLKIKDEKSIKTTAKAQFYDLSVKLFLDVNRYSDTIQILSKTVLDPYESYFELEMNKETQCFINIYFDLVEMERRKLMTKILASDKSDQTIQKLYEESNLSIYYLKQKYFREVERGKEFDKMKKWNKTVRNELQIDNIGLFFPDKNE